VPCLSGERGSKTGTGNGTSPSDTPFLIAKHIGTPKVKGCDGVSWGKEGKTGGPRSASRTLNCKHCHKQSNLVGWDVLSRHATSEELKLAAKHYQ
jgi:hypothetical protein